MFAFPGKLLQAIAKDWQKKNFCWLLHLGARRKFYRTSTLVEVCVLSTKLNTSPTYNYIECTKWNIYACYIMPAIFKWNIIEFLAISTAAVFSRNKTLSRVSPSTLPCSAELQAEVCIYFKSLVRLDSGIEPRSTELWGPSNHYTITVIYN